MKLEFKKGSKYSRKDIGWVCYPDKGRPAGGDWDTGYVRVEDNLIIFMNIGVPGTTEHDFDNHYDHSKGIYYEMKNTYDSSDRACRINTTLSNKDSDLGYINWSKQSSTNVLLSSCWKLPCTDVNNFEVKSINVVD